jgi:hypothetical protein
MTCGEVGDRDSDEGQKRGNLSEPGEETGNGSRKKRRKPESKEQKGDAEECNGPKHVKC